TVSMAAALVQRQGELSPAQSSAARRIESSAARMSRLIDQLLDLARARMGGGIPVDPKPETNLSDVVSEAVEELRTAHPDAQLRMDAEKEIHGSWDPDRMAQVVSNLVANAIHYGDGLVEVRLRSGPGSAILEVHNGGQPIPAEFLPRIFEPFR